MLDYMKPVSVTSSAYTGAAYEPAKAFDGSFGTLWVTDNTAQPAWITADFRKQISINGIEPVFDRIMGGYQYKVDYSTNGTTWTSYAEGNNATASEWPVEHKKGVKARYIRVSFLNVPKELERVGLWEVRVY